MNVTKRWGRLAAAVLVAGCLTIPACAGNTSPNTSPTVQVIATANDVVVGLGTLQHAAIELNKAQTCTTATPPACTPLLSEANTRIVVNAVGEALKTIQQVPNGWKATAGSALTAITARLDAAGQAKLAAYIQAVRTITGF